MQLDIKDLVPGSKWIQSSSGIISEIVQGPFCSIDFKDQESICSIPKPKPQVLKKTIGGVQNLEYLNKVSMVNAYNFLYYSQPYHD